MTAPLRITLTQSARDVDRIVAFLNPTGGPPFRRSIADCRRAVEHAVKAIRDPLLAETAASERRRLTRIEVKLRAARAAISDDDPPLTAVLERAVAKYRDMIESLPPKRHEKGGKGSGGAGGRRAAEQKRVAADKAFDLMVDYGSVGTPTLTKGGKYITLANMLFKAATGGGPPTCRGRA